MFEKIKFDGELSALINAGRLTDAEDKLVATYSAMATVGDEEALEHLARRLAQFYCSPDSENLQRAEEWFIKCEDLSPRAYSRFQTALFYLYVMKSNENVIEKVSQIDPDQADMASYYSALTLKGIALLNLDRTDDTLALIQDLLVLVKTTPNLLPLGDEINLIEAALPVRALRVKCRELLQLTVPMIRDAEYRSRGVGLLNSHEVPDELI